MEVLFGTESLETFTNVSEEILDDLYVFKPSTEISLEAHNLQTTKEEIRKLLSDCDFDITRVSEAIEAKGWEQQKAKTFLSLLEKKKTKLLYAALVNNNSIYGETIADFDWLLKMVCGTDKLKSLRYPAVQLILSTVNHSGVRRQRVYDVNKEMLAKLINVLESNV